MPRPKMTTVDPLAISATFQAAPRPNGCIHEMNTVEPNDLYYIKRIDGTNLGHQYISTKRNISIFVCLELKENSSDCTQKLEILSIHLPNA